MKTVIKILAIVMVVMLGCKTSKETSTEPLLTKQKERNSSEIEVGEFNSSLSLADYLKRQAGVTVRGSSNNPIIRIRASGTISSDPSKGGNVAPLFVIDNQQVGNDYNHVSAVVDVNHIKYIRILKSTSELVDYGLQGANGVILITTKGDK